MHVLDVIDQSRIDRIADKTMRLVSLSHEDLGHVVSDVELRLYHKKTKNGPYSIITIFVETNKGTVEQILNEGYLGPHSLEEEMSYLTSHLVVSGLILNAVMRLDEQIKFPEANTIELRKQNLIAKIKSNGFLKDLKVERAIRVTPRHFFVPDDFVEQSYEDRPLPTKSMQTISQPSVVAMMSELLDVKNHHKILEIGCGSGWQSAILSRLTSKKILSIERLPEIVEFARKNHQKAGVQNVEIIQGDGTLGLAEWAPFDRIIITAACKKIPEPLLNQLNKDGILVAPVGDYYFQDMVVVQKTTQGAKVIRRDPGFIFAPLIGKYGF